MQKTKRQARASSAARVVRPSRVEIVVRKTGRTMRCSAAEARALVALKVADYVVTPDPPRERSVMVAGRDYLTK